MFGLVKQEFIMISIFLENKKDIYEYIYRTLNAAPESFLGILELPEIKIMEVYQYFEFLYDSNIHSNFDSLASDEQHLIT